MPALPRSRLRVAAWLTALAVLSGLALWAGGVRWTGQPIDRPAARPSLVDATAALSSTERPGDADAAATGQAAGRHAWLRATVLRADAYPGPGTPRPPTSTVPPAPTASPTTDMRRALPPGAVVDGAGPWRDEDALVASYRLDGEKAIAVVSADGERLLWDSRGEPSLPRHAARANFGGCVDSEAVMGDHVTVTMDDVGAAIQLGRGDDGVVHRRLFMLAAGDWEGYACQTIMTINQGVEGVPHTAVGIQHGDDVGPGYDALIVYGDGDVPPVVGRFAEPVEVLDVDGDGTEEVVQADGKGGRTVRRAGDAYASAQAYPDPSAGPSTAPTPVVVPADQGAMPALPAGLCVERDGGIACWPKAGGAPKVVWSPGDDGWRLDALADDYNDPAARPHAFVSAGDGRWLVMAQVKGAYGTPGVRSRLMVIDRRSGERVTFDRAWGWSNNPWNTVHQWSVDAALTRLAWVELGVRADGRPAAPGDGVLYVVDLGRDGERLRPGPRRVVATCPAAQLSDSERAECRGVVLSPDGRLAALMDGEGLWIVDVATGKRVGGIAHVVVPSDEAAVRSYRPAAWSPDGRRLHVAVGHYEGLTDAVLDVATSDLYDVPDSTTWASRSHVAFDGMGRVVHAQFEGYGTGALSLLRLDMAAAPMTTFGDGSRGYVAGEAWRSPLLSVGPMLFNPFDPVVVGGDGGDGGGGGEVRFGLQRAVDSAAVTTGVYSMPLGEHPSDSRRLLALPTWPVEDDTEARTAGTIEWTPDGDGFLYWQSEGERRTVHLGVLGASPRLYDVVAQMAGVRSAMWDR
ncbi:MAG: hypothetical protein ABI780_13220 [Ardenticatenales bacterium]